MDGLQNKESESIQDELMKGLKKYFNNKITSSYTVLHMTDTPYVMFSFSFIMYDCFNVVLNYDRGRFGCHLVIGEKKIPIKNSQKWYDTADMNIFYEELEQQLELRIPDKFLEYYGWK